MSQKRVLFIEPSGNLNKVFSDTTKLPLTGCLYLGTILHNAGYGVEIINENILGREVDLLTLEADIFCLTALTVSANRAKLLAMELRCLYPECKIIIGGAHASLVPEFFTDVADHVVIGEAEGIILSVIEEKVPEKIIYGGPLQDLDLLPLIHYELLRGVESVPVIPIMTSRGCPFNCNFCSVTKIFGKKFRFQSPERIIAEIKHSLLSFKSNYIFFYDDNFTANRKRIHKLCELILAEDIDIRWGVQLRSEIALYPDLIKKMAQAGCDRVFIGFESINDTVLQALEKKQSRHDIEQAITIFHRYGVKIHGMFMFGEDNETLEILQETVTFAINQHIDTVQFMILTPLPGTELFDRMVTEERLFHYDWSYYDGMYVVFQPNSISAYQLQCETGNAYKRFYSLRRSLLDLLNVIFTIFLDALTWNFSRAAQYHLDTIFLKIAGKVLLRKYVQSYASYAEYLKRVEYNEEKNI